jgi:hypothetical protein
MENNAQSEIDQVIEAYLRGDNFKAGSTQEFSNSCHEGIRGFPEEFFGN